MLGRDHTLSGLAAGLAAGILLHKSPAVDGELAAFTAGMALLPDLDSCGSGPARSLGLISGAVSHIVRRISGGHRHGTHSLLGIAVFTGLAVLAGYFRHDYAGMAGLALLITLTVSGAAECTRVLDGHKADLLGAAVAAGVVFAGYGLALIPLAVGLGCTTHLLGDSLTDSGVNWFWPLSQHRFHIPEPFAFTTGTKPEARLVRPALYCAVALLAVIAAGHGLALHAVRWALAEAR